MAGETNDGRTDCANNTDNSTVLYTSPADGFVYDQQYNLVPNMLVRDNNLVLVNDESVSIADVVRLQIAMAYKVSKLENILAAFVKESRMRIDGLFQELRNGSAARCNNPSMSTSGVSTQKVALRKLIDSIEEMNHLENQLMQNDTKEKMMSECELILGNRSSGVLNDCYTYVDNIFSKRFFTLVTWSGGSNTPGAKKFCFRDYCFFKVFFMELMRKTHTTFADADYEDIFKNKFIRNSTSRAKSTGQRKSAAKHRGRNMRNERTENYQNEDNGVDLIQSVNQSNDGDLITVQSNAMATLSSAENMPQTNQNKNNLKADRPDVEIAMITPASVENISQLYQNGDSSNAGEIDALSAVVTPSAVEIYSQHQNDDHSNADQSKIGVERKLDCTQSQAKIKLQPESIPIETTERKSDSDSDSDMTDFKYDFEDKLKRAIKRPVIKAKRTVKRKRSKRVDLMELQEKYILDEDGDESEFESEVSGEK